MADAAFTSRGLFCVCDMMFSVNVAGLVRKHGPVNCRRTGSNKLPKLPEQPLATPYSHATTDPAGEEPMSEPHAISHNNTSYPLSVQSRCSNGFPGHAAEKLASILNVVVNDNDHASWLRLLCFSSLYIPQR